MFACLPIIILITSINKCVKLDFSHKFSSWPINVKEKISEDGIVVKS